MLIYCKIERAARRQKEFLLKPKRLVALHGRRKVALHRGSERLHTLPPRTYHIQKIIAGIANIIQQRIGDVNKLRRVRDPPVLAVQHNLPRRPRDLLHAHSQRLDAAVEPEPPLIIRHADGSADVVPNEGQSQFLAIERGCSLAIKGFRMRIHYAFETGHLTWFKRLTLQIVDALVDLPHKLETFDLAGLIREQLLGNLAALEHLLHVIHLARLAGRHRHVDAGGNLHVHEHLQLLTSSPHKVRARLFVALRRLPGRAQDFIEDILHNLKVMWELQIGPHAGHVAENCLKHRPAHRP